MIQGLETELGIASVRQCVITSRLHVPIKLIKYSAFVIVLLLQGMQTDTSKVNSHLLMTSN